VISSAFDVVVLGEVLVEIATSEPFRPGVSAVLGVSGDALNCAANAAAAGARVGLVAVIGDDELGGAIAKRIAELGVSLELLRVRPGQQGMYLVHSDPEGARAFSYARRGSVGSTLGPGDVPERVVRDAGIVVASGIPCAISDSAREAVFHAAGLASRFVFDPNFRPSLTTIEEAALTMRELAPLAETVTPSHPFETNALLGATSAEEAGGMLLALGARHALITCGAEGAVLMGGAGTNVIPAVPAPLLIDQTGAGDALLGAFCARLARGDSHLEAARYAAAAASLSLSGQGGLGHIVAARKEIRAID